MEPHSRDENEENILEDMIRDEDDASHFLNDSGEGDECLSRGDGISNAWEEAELGVSNEGEADKAEVGGSGATLIITNYDNLNGWPKLSTNEVFFAKASRGCAWTVGSTPDGVDRNTMHYCSLL